MTQLLWHYTCDHGHAELGTSTAVLLPAATLAPPDQRLPFQSHYVWLTDMIAPDRAALGLTMQTLTCDRTAHRYRVTDTRDCHPWHAVRQAFSEQQRDTLETVPGALLMHWWVSLHPVPVISDDR